MNVPASYKKKSEFGLIIIFPIVALTVKDFGSIILTLLFLLSLIYVFREKKDIGTQERKVLIAFFLFFVASSISLLETEHLNSGLKRLERIFRFVMVIPIFFLLTKYKHDIKKLLVLSIVATAYVMFFQSLYQIYVQGLPTAQGAYHQILFGEYAVLVSGLLTAAYIFRNDLELSQRLGLLAALGAGLSFAVVILSEAKGAWLVYPVLFALFVIMFRKRLNTKQVIVISVTGILVAGIVGSTPPVQRRLSVLHQDFFSYRLEPRKEGTLSTRINMWRDSWLIFKKFPFIGSGLGDYESDVSRLMKDNVSYQTRGKYSHPHSIYFDALGSTGIIGFLIMISALFVLPFRLFYRSWSGSQNNKMQFYPLGGMVCVVTYAVSGLSETWLAQNSATNVYALFIVLFMALLSKDAGISTEAS